jgi:hypothetical protein
MAGMVRQDDRRQQPAFMAHSFKGDSRGIAADITARNL